MSERLFPLIIITIREYLTFGEEAKLDDLLTFCERLELTDEEFDYHVEVALRAQ